MAAPASKTYATLFGHADLLEDPALDHDTMWNALGTANGGADTRYAILSLSQRSPTVIAYVSDHTPSTISLCHTPRLYYPSPGAGACDLDNQIIALQGNTPGLITPVLLPPNVFNLGTESNVYNDFAAHSTALQTAIAADGTHVEVLPAGTRGTAAREKIRCMVLPCSMASRAVALPQSHLSITEFYDLFVYAHVADASYEPLRRWWQLASTVAAGARPATAQEVDLDEVVVTPLLQERLQHWALRWVKTDLACIRGPDVTAGVTAALGDIHTQVGQVVGSMTAAETARAAEAAAAAMPMEFGDRFGTAVLDLLLRFVRQGAAADLPVVHQEMAKYKERSRDTTTINLALYSEAQAMPHINDTNLPKCTAYLLSIFRSHGIVGNSLELGEGFNPFSIVCQGHPNTKDVLVLADQISTLESGSTSVSLQEASQFKTKDGRFPHTYMQAVDKLWAFALVVRVYSGPNSAIARALVDSLTETAPMILNLESEYFRSNKQGLMIAIRIMLFYQRAVTLYYRKARDTAVPVAVTNVRRGRIDV